MKKLKIYLDTSVISHLDAPDVPEKMADTQRLWEDLMSGVYEIVLGDIVFDELNRCSEPKRSKLREYVKQLTFERIDNSSEMLRLSERFIDYGILREKSIDDCLHIATALMTGCDYIVSWNFKHIVNPKTIKGVKVVTTMEGYKDLIICSPSMLIGGERNGE